VPTIPPPSTQPPQNEPQSEEPAPEPQSEGPSVVRTVVPQGSYRVGETVQVQVVIENASNVGSVPFHLRFNPQVLQFVPPGLEGAFLNADGTGTVFLASDTGGEVVVGISRLGGDQGASGNGVLATFQFLAIAEGNAGFAFTGASVKDPQARNVASSFGASSVNVEP